MEGHCIVSGNNLAFGQDCDGDGHRRKRQGKHGIRNVKMCCEHQEQHDLSDNQTWEEEAEHVG